MGVPSAVQVALATALQLASNATCYGILHTMICHTHRDQALPYETEDSMLGAAQAFCFAP